MMARGTDGDVHLELNALRQRLCELEAEHRLLLGRTGCSSRPRRAPRFLLATLSILMLASGGLLYAQSNGVGLVIDPNGHVGIGTAQPMELLEVATPGGARAIVSNGGGAERRAILVQSPSTETGHGRIVAYDYKAKSGLPLLLQDSGGNVGIGSGQRPAEDLEDRLDVAGSLRILTGKTQNPLRFTSDYLPWADDSGQQQWRKGATISNDTKNYKSLMIVGNRSGDNETRRVSIFDRLDVAGDAEVQKTLTAESIDVTGLTADSIDVTGRLDTRTLKVAESLEAPNLIRGLVSHVMNNSSQVNLDCKAVGTGRCNPSKQPSCDAGTTLSLVSRHYCAVYGITDGQGYCYTYACVSP